MSKILVATCVCLMLLGCASTPEMSNIAHTPSRYGDHSSYGVSSNDGLHAGPHAGQWAVAAVGTPFYLAFKTVICGASVVVAAPTAAIIALADSPYSIGVDKLGDGLAANCGPPYVLSPS
ncbi:MAG: hypothetical protein ACR2Q4_21420 [Geminicoccaceae bacterium]